ncbi:MAG: branched-chain amino acid ABC transporter permease [Desulfobacterales bacterium]
MGLFLQLLTRGIITGSLYALLGMSWGIIYNTTRTFHFAHGFIYTLTAYVILVLVGISLPLVPSLLLGLLAATLAGCSLEYFAYLPMRQKNASQLSVFLTAMGIMIAGQSLIHLIFGPDSKPLAGFPEHVISLGAVTFTTIDLFTVVLSWIAIVLLFVFMARTKAGMMIRAVASNPEKATFIGIDSRKIFVLVFGIGSLLAGIAAFLATLDKPANPNIGLGALLISFITVFLGGVGSLAGAVLGGMILGIAESLVIIVLPTEYKMVVIFFILFLVILIKPEGLMGKKLT